MDRSMILAVVEHVTQAWHVNANDVNLDDKTGVFFILRSPTAEYRCWATDDMRLILGGEGECALRLHSALVSLCAGIAQEWAAFGR